MISESDFLDVVHTELELPVGGTAGEGLDRAIRWDSLTVLKLVAAVERRAGRRVPVGRLLRKKDLQAVYDVLAAA